MVVLPASISTVASPGGSWSTAAAAIRSFSSGCERSRSLSPVSTTVMASTAIAPPWTRRTSRRSSKVDRSRRTVSVVTANCADRSLTDIRPRRVIRSTMACWRSWAYKRASLVAIV